jgi:hypothetical protein
MKPLALVVFLVAAGCASHHAQLAFKVIPSQPSYLLRSPELKDTTFPETPGLFHRRRFGLGRSAPADESSHRERLLSRRRTEAWLGRVPRNRDRHVSRPTRIKSFSS